MILLIFGINLCAGLNMAARPAPIPMIIGISQMILGVAYLIFALRSRRRIIIARVKHAFFMAQHGATYDITGR